MESKKISDLEHDLIYKEIENISNKMHSGFASIEDSLKANFSILRAENKAATVIRETQLEEILTEQKKTNGRVKGLESVTSVLKIMRKNRWLTALVLYAIYNLLDLSTLQNVMHLYKLIRTIL